MAIPPRIPRHLRFGLFIAAALFFWNPIVAVIDPLPDCIGYLLLWFALGYAADLHTYLAEARRGFLRMAGIDALKLVSLLWLVTVPVAEEKPSAQLLLTFVFAVLELIYAIPAWNNFFDGMYGLIANDGDLRTYDLVSRPRKVRVKCETEPGKKAEYRTVEKPPRIRSLPELLKGGTVAWIIWRAVLTTLPEMSALSSFEHEGYVTNYDVDIYSFRGLFVTLAVFVMMIIGLRWLWRMLRFTSRLRRDAALIEALSARYADTVLPDEGLFLRRRIKLGLTVATIGAILSVDFYVEEMNILPDVLAAALFVAAILVLRHCSDRWLPALCAAGTWGVASIVSAYCANAFHSEFYPALVYKNSGAYDAYRLMCTATVIEQIAFAGAMVCFGMLLISIIRRVDAGLWIDLRGKVIGWIVLAVLSAGSGVAYDLLLPSVEFIWLIDFAICLLFAGHAWKGLGDLYDALAVSIRDGLTQQERIMQDVRIH